MLPFHHDMAVDFREAELKMNFLKQRAGESDYQMLLRSTYSPWVLSMEVEPSPFYYPEQNLTYMRCWKWLEKQEIVAPRCNVSPRSSHLTYNIKQAYKSQS
jgi:hypothetical protein